MIIFFSVTIIMITYIIEVLAGSATCVYTTETLIYSWCKKLTMPSTNEFILILLPFYLLFILFKLLSLG